MTVITPAPRRLWREVLEADPDALVTQSPEWLDAMCEWHGWTDASRAYLLPGDRIAVLPAVRRRGWGLPMMASLPNAWGMGGIISNQPVDSSVVAAVTADLRATGPGVVHIRPNPLQEPAWHGAAGSIVIPRRAHLLDLRDGFEWERAFAADTRRKIRKALASGVETRLDTSGADLPVFYELFERSLRRWAERQHEPIALAVWRGRRRDPIDKFRTIARHLGPALRLWTAHVGGRPAAALIVLQGTNAHYTRGSIDETLSGPSGAAHLLQHLAIQDAVRHGCRTYHMGETGASEGLARFKEHLGAQAHRYAEYRFEKIPFTRLDHAARQTAKRLIGFRDA